MHGVTEGVIGNQYIDMNGIAPGNRYQGNNNTGVFPLSGFGLYRYVLGSPPLITFQVNPNSGSDYYQPTSSSNNFGSAIFISTQNGTTPYQCQAGRSTFLRDDGTYIPTDSVIAQAEEIITDTAMVGRHWRSHFVEFKKEPL